MALKKLLGTKKNGAKQALMSNSSDVANSQKKYAEALTTQEVLKNIRLAQDAYEKNPYIAWGGVLGNIAANVWKNNYDKRGITKGTETAEGLLDKISADFEQKYANSDNPVRDGQDMQKATDYIKFGGDSLLGQKSNDEILADIKDEARRQGRSASQIDSIVENITPRLNSMRKNFNDKSDAFYNAAILGKIKQGDYNSAMNALQYIKDPNRAAFLANEIKFGADNMFKQKELDLKAMGKGGAREGAATPYYVSAQYGEFSDEDKQMAKDLVEAGKGDKKVVGNYTASYIHDVAQSPDGGKYAKLIFKGYDFNDKKQREQWGNKAGAELAKVKDMPFGQRKAYLDAFINQDDVQRALAHPDFQNEYSGILKKHTDFDDWDKYYSAMLIPPKEKPVVPTATNKIKNVVTGYLNGLPEYDVTDNGTVIQVNGGNSTMPEELQQKAAEAERQRIKEQAEADLLAKQQRDKRVENYLLNPEGEYEDY